jgi:DNA adenine methylase
MLIKVIHGSNDDYLGVAGKTIKLVSNSIRQSFNIPDGALAFVNGKQVAYNHILESGDILEFCKQFGEKRGSSFIRYPGGKWKLRGPIIKSLEPLLQSKIQYREPFFGGGGIGLELLQLGRLSSVWINDKDAAMAALWTSVIRYPDDLKRLVTAFLPTKTSFQEFRNDLRGFSNIPTSPEDVVNIGFKKLALHQISYSGLGVMSGGPLTAIDSRWSPKHICKKIDSIHRNFSLVSVKGDACSSLDFEELIDDSSLLYLDPPYYKQGATLYKYAFSIPDHERLARLLSSRKAPWLLSYDDCPEIRSMYDWAKIESTSVKYSITTAAARKELLISPRG